jgi:hypothetical protein
MRKRRTRGHIIEDLGFNHVERQVLLAGYTVQKIIQDYGYDGFIQTYFENGEIEADPIIFQLKSTDHIKKSTDGVSILIDLNVRDLEYWLSGQFVMILILYDAMNHKAYYVELKEYFKKNRTILSKVRKFVRINISLEHQVDAQSIINLRKLKNIFHGKSKDV